MGTRCVQYLFKLLVDEMPESFSLLEIGVYKGQILSLTQALATRTNKKAKILGVTPLVDKDFGGDDRLPDIQRLFKILNITMENTEIIDGLSQNVKVIERVKQDAPFDLMFIDGDHSYEGARSDMNTYVPMLKEGGFLVVNDTNNFRQFPAIYDPTHNRESLFTGLEPVSRATRDCLENNPSLKDLLAVMHTRLFQRAPA